MNQVQTDVARERSIWQGVVESLAEAEETEPTELVPPLSEAIDPDALERLFANDRVHGKVVFTYDQYEVSVFSDRYVSIDSHGARPR